jgi:hypothetical protein
MSEIERRLGVTPIAELLADRDVLVEQVADLRAEHGSFGTWDARRKAELSRIAQSLRANLHQQGKKLTVAEVDSMAHASPEYYDLVIEATRARAQLARLDSRIFNIEATIQRGNIVARHMTAEARL